ncbi:hypothetical protein GCM10009616_04100 [Microlunatus lacustris]
MIVELTFTLATTESVAVSPGAAEADKLAALRRAAAAAVVTSARAASRAPRPPWVPVAVEGAEELTSGPTMVLSFTGGRHYLSPR